MRRGAGLLRLRRERRGRRRGRREGPRGREYVRWPEDRELRGPPRTHHGLRVQGGRRALRGDLQRGPVLSGVGPRGAVLPRRVERALRAGADVSGLRRGRPRRRRGGGRARLGLAHARRRVPRGRRRGPRFLETVLGGGQGRRRRLPARARLRRRDAARGRVVDDARRRPRVAGGLGDARPRRRRGRQRRRRAVLSSPRLRGDGRRGRPRRRSVKRGSGAPLVLRDARRPRRLAPAQGPRAAQGREEGPGGLRQPEEGAAAEEGIVS